MEGLTAVDGVGSGRRGPWSWLLDRGGRGRLAVWVSEAGKDIGACALESTITSAGGKLTHNIWGVKAILDFGFFLFFFLFSH
jgi:hypothetical protein